MELIGQTVQHYQSIKCEQLIRFAKFIGIESLEINPQGVALDNVETIIDAIGSLRTTFHLPIIGDSGYDFSFTSKKDKIENVIKLLNNYSAQLNIQVGVFHPIEDPESGDFQTLVENLSQLNIPLIIENVPSYSNEEFAQYYLRVKDELPDLVIGWLFDVAHSYLRNGLKGMFNLLDVLPFDELVEIHLSDCLEDEDAHYSFGSGILPMDLIFEEIKKRNFQRYLVNEIGPHPTIWSVVDSYMEVAKLFKRKLFVKMLFRKMMVKPMVNSKLKKAKII